MSYTPQTWVDGEDGGTPLSAARLAHIEAGIVAAGERFAGNEPGAKVSAVPNADDPTGEAFDGGVVIAGTLSGQPVDLYRLTLRDAGDLVVQVNGAVFYGEAGWVDVAAFSGAGAKALEDLGEGLSAVATRPWVTAQLAALETGGGGAAASVSAVEFYGHSYGAGAGAHAPSYRFSSRLCRALRAVELNFANAGTRIIDEGRGAGNGGWTWVGINRVPTAPRPAGHEYDAPIQVASIDYGVNEFIGGQAAPNMTQLAHSFRSVIHMCLASQRFSHDNPVLSYTGGFTGVTDYADAQIGRSLRGSAGANGTVTLAVPAGYPGGTVGMSFIGALGRGARLSFTIDGADAGTLDARNAHPVAGRFNQATKRLALSAGAHTVVATVDAVSPADVFFDCASYEATTPPLVIVHNIARTPGYPGPFATQNAAIAGVVDEFGDNVVLLDADSVLGAVVANFNPDNLHPSDAGHSLLAKAVYDLIQMNADLIPGADAILLG